MGQVGLRRTHRWIIDNGNDHKKSFTLPDPIRLVAIVEHGPKPFDVEVQMKACLWGLWRNSFRYLAGLASGRAERFVIDRYEGDGVLTEEMAKKLTLAKYKPYVVE